VVSVGSPGGSWRAGALPQFSFTCGELMEALRLRCSAWILRHHQIILETVSPSLSDLRLCDEQVLPK